MFGPDLGQNCLESLSADDTRRLRVNFNLNVNTMEPDQTEEQCAGSTLFAKNLQNTTADSKADHFSHKRQ